MMIEIHKPELEALIRARMDSGEFKDFEDVLLQALQSIPEPPPSQKKNTLPPRTTREVFQAIAGLADDVDFSRNPSTGRPVQIA